MLYIVVFYWNTLLSAFVIYAMFAVLDDIIEDVTDRKNRIGISDNRLLVGVIEAEFTIVLFADTGFFKVECNANLGI